MTDQITVLNRIDTNLDSALDRLLDLLRIRSISTDPAYKDECQKAGQWLVDDLNSIGFDATLHPTDGHPMVVAHHDGPEGAPHVLFYGHYDVQPVDPIELWDHDPFDPDIVEVNGAKRLRGRGTSDDKGQLMTFVEACRAIKAECGQLPCKISILFEGEEESGSPSLLPFLEKHGDELKADLALVCDTNMWDRETAAITLALRGMANEEVVLHCANRDLHSGYYGGAARNPIHVLSEILAAMHDEKGRVTLDNFYDGVPELPQVMRDQWKDLEGNNPTLLSEIGLAIPAGETGYSALEQTWARPTAEVNGIIGGYTGEGFKTVIPAQASAKVSFRLVGDQDPHKVIDAFHAHVSKYLPEDCRVEFIPYGRSKATNLPHDMPAVQKAVSALSDEWGGQAALIAGGGSIPIVGNFKRELGMDSLLVGFGLSEDNIHSPNEKYEVSSFHKGARSWARILFALADG